MFFILVLTLSSFANSSNLSRLEQQEIDARLEQFYGAPMEASVMDKIPPKFSFERGRFDSPIGVVKNNKMVQKYRCEKFLKCDDLTNAEIEANDKPEDLTASYIDDLETDLSKLPEKGEIKSGPWSGDYWQMRRGLTSYRYAEGRTFRNYSEAVESYQQPSEWTTLVDELNPEELAKKVIRWSPSEKYDLTVGDVKFKLTNEQKNEGKDYLDSDGDVPSWYGICHGWAAAAITVPSPKKNVEVRGATGVRVTWYPDDIRAMASLAWANGSFPTSFIGGRCNEKDVTRYPNGRIKDQDCFDTNPATFHQVIANMVGKGGVPFIMDGSYDYQVWNQPIVAYSVEYFNPLKTTERSTDWKKVAVDYDDKFKAIDRFQDPNTRGVRNSRGKYDDSKVEKIVGVVASVSYLTEVTPVASEKARGPSIYRVTYTYDLELSEKSGKLVPTGGEWHENAHPDFLWVPKREAMVSESYDSYTPDVNLDREPDESLTKVASSASQRAYPLCKVVKALVNESNSGGSYECAH